MADLRTKIVIDLQGNLEAQAQKMGQSLQNLGTRGSKAMQTLKGSISAMSSGLDRIGNRYTAMLTGAAGIGAVKQIGDLNMRLSMLGIQAGKSTEDMDQFYQKVLDVANMPDIRVDPSGLVSAVETIVEKTGDLDTAQANLRNIGLAMRAAGAEGVDAGDMVANMKEKFGLKNEKEVLQAMDILVKQGKAGAFTLKDLATQGNRVFAAYASMGGKGVEGIKQMGAVLQVFRKSSGSSEEASTAFKNLFNDLMQKQAELGKGTKKVKGLGISIWDPNELKQGHKVLKPIVNLLDEIMTKTKGDPDKLSKIFGMQTMDGLKAFIAEWQKSGKNAAKEFMNVGGDGSELMNDSARMAKEFNAALQSLYTSWQRFATAQLTGPVRSLADSLNSLGEDTVQRWLEIGKNIALVMGGLIAFNKVAQAGMTVGKGVSWLTGIWGNKGGVAGKAAGALGGLTGGSGLPVFVTNWPGQGTAMPWLPPEEKAAETVGKTAGQLGAGAVGVTGAGVTASVVAAATPLVIATAGMAYLAARRGDSSYAGEDLGGYAVGAGSDRTADQFIKDNGIGESAVSRAIEAGFARIGAFFSFSGGKTSELQPQSAVSYGGADPFAYFGEMKKQRSGMAGTPFAAMTGEDSKPIGPTRDAAGELAKIPLSLDGIRQELTARDEKIVKQVEVGGALNIHVTSEGRAVVQGVQNKNKDVAINVDSGMMMAGH